MRDSQIIFEKTKNSPFYKKILSYNPSTKIILATFISALLLSTGYLVMTDAHFSPVLAKKYDKKKENRRTIARTETALAKSQSKNTNHQVNRYTKQQRLQEKEQRLLEREAKIHEKLQKIEQRQQRLEQQEQTQPTNDYHHEIEYMPVCTSECEQESQRALIRKREKTEISVNDITYQEKTVFKQHDTDDHCAYFSDKEKMHIRAWLHEQNLNRYGDPKDTVYAGGTPLFNEMTGYSMNRYTYICMQHPDRPWNWM